MARNNGVKILDVRVEGIPEGLVTSGIIGSLSRAQAERIRCGHLSIHVDENTDVYVPLRPGLIVLFRCSQTDCTT